MEQLLEELVITYRANLNGWQWETDEFCCEDGLSSPDAAYADFVRVVQELGFTAAALVAS
jgi:hypothetical protein